MVLSRFWAWVFPQPEEPQVEDEVAYIASEVLEEVLTNGYARWWFEDLGLGRDVAETLTQGGWVYAQQTLVPSRGQIEFAFSV